MDKTKILNLINKNSKKFRIQRTIIFMDNALESNNKFAYNKMENLLKKLLNVDSIDLNQIKKIFNI